MTDGTEQIVINKLVNDASDSLEIGAPSKGGAVKVYHNADDLEGFKRKIKNMLEARDFANSELAKKGTIV